MEKGERCSKKCGLKWKNRSLKKNKFLKGRGRENRGTNQYTSLFISYGMINSYFPFIFKFWTESEP